MKEEVKAMKIENDQDRSAWQAAASRWRLPYWDWAATNRLPELVCNQNINVVTSWNSDTGTPDKKSVPNPMYRFQMPGGQPMGHKSYGNYRIDPSDGLPVRAPYGFSHRILLIMVNSLTFQSAPAGMVYRGTPRKARGSTASPTLTKSTRPSKPIIGLRARLMCRWTIL